MTKQFETTECHMVVLAISHELPLPDLSGVPSDRMILVRVHPSCLGEDRTLDVFRLVLRDTVGAIQEVQMPITDNCILLERHPTLEQWGVLRGALLIGLANAWFGRTVIECSRYNHAIRDACVLIELAGNHNGLREAAPGAVWQLWSALRVLRGEREPDVPDKVLAEVDASPQDLRTPLAIERDAFEAMHAERLAQVEALAGENVALLRKVARLEEEVARLYACSTCNRANCPSCANRG